MSRKLLDLWVGFFVALGLAAVLFLALKVGNLSAANFSETYSLTAKFVNIGGLKVRAPVKSAGVVVGRVAEITRDDELDLVLRLSQAPHHRMAKETVAAGDEYALHPAAGFRHFRPPPACSLLCPRSVSSPTSWRGSGRRSGPRPPTRRPPSPRLRDRRRR